MIELVLRFPVFCAPTGRVEHQEEAGAPEAALSSTTDVRNPARTAVLNQLVDGGDARACYCALAAA